MATRSSKTQMVGDGIELTVDGEYTTIRFRNDNDFGPSKGIDSKTGQPKSDIVASTRGGVRLPDGAVVTLTAYRPRK